MESEVRRDRRQELLTIIRGVRRRWRMKLALRGAAASLAVFVVALLAGAYALEAARFSAGMLVTLRILIPVVLAALVGWFMVRPLRRQVSDEQVALYLEEHEPSLEASIISAVQATGPSASSDEPLSHALVDRLVESALDKCATSGVDVRIEQRPVRRYGLVIAATVVAATTAVLFGPGYLRAALSALFDVSGSAEAAVPYRIDVTPGDLTIPKGADQAVTARLLGFSTDDASLMVRTTDATAFERLPLVSGDNDVFEGMLFDLDVQTEYYVEADGVRSPTFTVKVVELPYVRDLELEYHFPAYTGLAPRKVEHAGDIAVLRGTEVRAKVTPTMAVPAGRILLHDQSVAQLTRQADGTFSTSFVVEKDGFYRVELDTASGSPTAASPQYTIDVLSDEAPLVTFQKPGRDRSASPLEEVFVEAHAQDDYGVRRLELVYSVNGGPETTVPLFDGRTQLDDVSAGHTFYLEELQVQPGDSVSYYARAADNSGDAANRATSDLFFLRVRPFGKEYRAAQSQGGGGGGGGGAGNEVNALSEQQRQIISATFNVQRDRRQLSAQKLRENAVVVALSQSRLREQVEGLLTRMNSSLVQQDPAFQKISELLPQAVKEMQAAEQKLQAVDPSAALTPEQRALRFLQQAEEEYELQVTSNRNAGGGGGGGTSSVADELASMFEEELDKMANQYETVQRAEEQGAEQRLDDLMEKLKDLARRQEQEAERQRRLSSSRSQNGSASAGGAGSSGGSSSGGNSGSSGASGASAAQQRQLAEQAEAAARELERLSREEKQPDLLDAAKRLQEAAAAMRRAAANGDGNAASQAAAALERLRETQRRLQQSRSDDLEAGIDQATSEAEALAREQQTLADDVRNASRATEGRGARAQELGGRKEAMSSHVKSLQDDLDRLAAGANRNARDAGRKLSEAADAMRNERVLEKLRYSKAMVERGMPWETAQRLEADVQASLDATVKKLREAGAALDQAKPDSMETALDRARRLARGLESLEQRTAERLERGPGADRGSAGNGRDAQAQSSDPDQEGRGGQAQRGNQQGSGNASGQQAGQQAGQQGGSQGSQAGQGGSADGFGANDGTWGGGWGGWSGYDRRLGRLTESDIRQLRGEMRQWSNEARELRGLLRNEEIDPKELDAILRAMRDLDDERIYQNTAELQRLQTLVSEGLKRVEYGLRRRAEAREQGEVLVAGSEQVPEAFRQLVEQYYRSLSRDGR